MDSTTKEATKELFERLLEVHGRVEEGNLDHKAMASVFRSFGETISDLEMKDIMTECGLGTKVDVYEFENLMCIRLDGKAFTEKELVGAFQSMDVDGDKYLSVNDVDSFLKAGGSKVNITRAAIDKMVKEVAGVGKEAVSLESFLDALS